MNKIRVLLLESDWAPKVTEVYPSWESLSDLIEALPQQKELKPGVFCVAANILSAVTKNSSDEWVPNRDEKGKLKAPLAVVKVSDAEPEGFFIPVDMTDEDIVWAIAWARGALYEAI